MKTKNITIFAIIAIIASSCLVKSLNPFYKDADLVYDPSFLGKWIDNDSSVWIIESYIFQGNKSNVDKKQPYKFSFIEKGKEPAVFKVHLFTLGEHLYLDFLPYEINVPEFTGFHLIPAHSLCRFDMYADSLNLKWFNETWLDSLIKEGKTDISYLRVSDKDENGNIILTASTDELQKFILQFGDDPMAFRDNSDREKPVKEREEMLTFTLKRVRK